MNKTFYATQLPVNKLRKNLKLLLFAMMIAIGASVYAGNPTYCVPSYLAPSCANQFGSNDFIDSISMANFNYGGLGCPTDGNNYSDYTANACMRVCTGYTYPVSLTPGYYSTGSDEYFGVFIDFNGDGDFDDPGEFFSFGASTNGSTVTGNITIPAGMGAINTRIRFVCQSFNGGSAVMQYNSCGNNGTLGEAVDYCITINATPAISFSQAPPQCGGTVNLNAGNPGATYLWSTTATSQSITASTSGLYSVTVTAPQGCSSSASTNVYIKDVPVVDLGQPVNSCTGNTVTLDAGNPGMGYHWLPGNAATQTINVTTSNNYAVTVTDPNTGCTGSGSVSVTFNPTPTVNLGQPATQCGGSIPLDAQNFGSTYLWSDNSTNEVLNATTSGIYRVTVTGTGNCTATASVQVTIDTVPTVDLGADFSACGAAILDAGDQGLGYTYLWNVNSQTSRTITVTQTNNYRVTVTNPNGNCTATDVVSVTIKPLPVIATLGPYPPQCGDTIVLDAGGNGTAYAWSDGSTNQRTVARTSGDYVVTVTAANGCSDSATAHVYIKDKPKVDLGPDKVQCGGNVVLDAGNPGSTYFWFDQSTNQTYTVSVTGIYSVTVTNPATGCTATDIIDITINYAPIVNLGNDTTTCGAPVGLNAGNPGCTYLWSTGETLQKITVYTTGIYRVTVTSPDGCVGTGSIKVTINPAPVVTLVEPRVICPTAIFLLEGGSPPGGTYYVNGVVQGVIDPSATGIGTQHIKYIYTTPEGCSDSASTDIYVEAQPYIHSNLLPDLCVNTTPIDLIPYYTPKGGVFSGIGITGGHYLSSVVNGAGPDTITYTYTDIYGCSDTNNYPIIIHWPVHVSMVIDPADFTICAGQTVTVSASGADTYEFFLNGKSTGQASPNNIFIDSTLVNHDEIMVAGNNVCSADTTDNAIIDVHPLPRVNAGNDTTIPLGTHILLNGSASGSGLLTYLWEPSTFLSVTSVLNPLFTGDDTISYTLIASDAYGCADSDQVTINVYIPDAIELPNVITPDGDGKNDMWMLNPKLNLANSNLVIFNRWGEEVYEAQNYANNWDGTYKSTGRKLPDGTYYYVLKVPFENNHVYRGAINILNSPAK